MATKDEREINNLIDQNKALNKILEEQRNNYAAMGQNIEARAKQNEIYSNNEKLINDLKSKANKLTEEQKKLLIQLENEQRLINSQLNREEASRKRINNTIGEFNKQLKLGFSYLMQSDKIIKQTILNLGMSGAKADMMRSSFEQSAGFVSSLGGNLEDISNIMTGYADETGRARVLSAEMVKDITLIGKGTGLGIEQATKLGAQFELMGFNAKSTMDYVQGVVDTSERMGVNTTKILKNINDNFKRLNNFNFQQGVKGYAQMASYAEKMKIDMNQALNSAEISKSLEGAIGLAAQLQVMGGEFAKTDPFELLFLSRNDPAKFTKKINDMTKGVVTFRKMADGTFDKFISPADRDRLAAVEKSLGMQTGELTTQALRMADMQKMRQQMAGLGLSKGEKKLIEGAAIYNKQTGKYEVMLAGRMKDISTLTKEQANSFAKEQVTLKKRAEESQTFDEAFKNTINELKSALLPILRGINTFLTNVRPVVEPIVKFLTGDKFLPGWLKVAGLFMTSALILKPLAQRLGDIVTKSITSRISGRGVNAGNVGGNVGQTVAGGTAGAGKTGAGMGMLRGGAGMGAAAAGIGAGIGIAAVGISKLADAMSKLDEKQAETLKSIVSTLGWFVVGGAAAAIAIGLLGSAGMIAVPAMLGFGAAVALVGVGIGAAAAGIGYMANGLASLVTAGKDAGPAMLQLAGGIGAISLAMLGMTGGIFGVLTFSKLMKNIAQHAPALAQVGDAFKQINAVMSGSKDDLIAVQNAISSIANTNVKGGSVFSELTNLLKSPLKVEFNDKKVAVVSDITLNIDGQKFMQKIYSSKVAADLTQQAKNGHGK